MDFGLYTLKYPLRKLLGFLIPLCRNINPNLMSALLIPLGVLTAWVYGTALSQGCGGLFLIGIFLCALRMIIATLDGLIAVEFGKSTAVGDVVNRVCPEVCDMMLLPTLIGASGHFDWLGLVALALAWATPFFGLLGAPVSVPVQSVGPVGQTDRLAAIMLFSLFEFLKLHFAWSTDVFGIFLYWLIFGGILTLILRFQRTLAGARARDLNGKV